MSEPQHQSPEHDISNEMMGMGKDMAKKAGNEGKKVAKKAMKKIGKEVGKAVAKVAKKAILAVGKAILSALTAIAPYLLIALAIVVVITAGWYVIYETRGAEQKYSLDKKVQANTNKMNDKGYFEASELNGENRAIKEFYQYFGTQKSYYQILTSDNTKLEQTTDVRDYYNKEQSYSINPNFLFALDEYAFKGEYRYPEQFVKPILYDSSKLTLKSLTNSSGALTAESKDYDKKTGLQTDKKVKGVWDYGFGTVFKYKEDQRTMTVEGTIYQKDVWDDTQKKIVQQKTNQKFAETMDGYPEKIWLITKAVTFAGDYKFAYKNQKTAKSDLEDGVGDKNSNRIRVQYGTYDEYRDEDVYDWVYHDEEQDVYGWVEHTEQKPIYGWVSHYEETNGGYSYYNTWEIIGYETVTVKKWEKTGTTTVAKKTWEKVGTKKVFVQTHKLYEYRKGNVYETVPVEVPQDNTDPDTSKREKYLRDYLFYFKSWVPESVMQGFNFEERVGSIINTNMPTGSGINSASFKKAYQDYFGYIEKYSKMYGVDPYVSLAQMMQESGGNPNVNADGLMQIHGHDGNYLSAKNVLTGQTDKIYVNTASKADPEKNIQMGVMELAGQIARFNGDVLKAIQSYNFDVSRIKKTHPQDYDSLAWMNWREETRLYYGQRELGKVTKSASYDCFQTVPSYAETASTRYGDACYVEHVMKYYAGTQLKGIDDHDADGKTEDKSIVDTIASYFGITVKEYKPEEPHRLFDHNGLSNRDVDWFLRSVQTFDSKVLFSKADEQETDVSFWDTSYSSTDVTFDTAEEFMKVVGSAKYVPPVNMKNPPVTSRFGSRWGKMHRGTDVGIPIGTPLYAIADGVAVVSITNQGDSKASWGNYVKIKIDGEENYALYGHMSKPIVKQGDHVKQGQLIGYSGNSGDSTGPHLHFEYYFGGPEKGKQIDSYFIVVQPNLFK